MICECCGKEYNKKTKFCSKSCYNKSYYWKNRDRLLEYHKIYRRAHYVPHPINKCKYNSDEERIRIQIERRKQYYKEHREKYKKANKEWYARNKDNPDLKRRHSITMKKYYKKKKKERAL